MSEFKDLPQAESCRLIDFVEVKIKTCKKEEGEKCIPPRYYLVVRGTKRWVNMDVRLVPVVYIQQPEYWLIEVVGCLHGVGLPAEAPYIVSIPLDGITGTKGIEVIGATRSEERQVPPK